MGTLRKAKLSSTARITESADAGKVTAAGPASFGERTVTPMFSSVAMIRSGPEVAVSGRGLDVHPNNNIDRNNFRFSMS